MIHLLKTIEPFFTAVKNGRKKFEVRFNDRNFQVGDYLALVKFESGSFTRECMFCEIVYTLDDERYCIEDNIIMSFNTMSYLRLPSNFTVDKFGWKQYLTAFDDYKNVK